MKATGIVKKIDELGRIVIPKEIRNTQKIRDGENFEIFIENEKIILKKYSQMNNFLDFSFNLANIFNRITNFQIIITDREKVVVNTNNNLDINYQEISNDLINYMEKRENVIRKNNAELIITNKEKIKCSFSINPLIINSELIGMIIVYINADDNNQLLLISNLLSNIIINYEEISVK